LFPKQIHRRIRQRIRIIDKKPEISFCRMDAKGKRRPNVFDGLCLVNFASNGQKGWIYELGFWICDFGFTIFLIRRKKRIVPSSNQKNPKS